VSRSHDGSPDGPEADRSRPEGISPVDETRPAEGRVRREPPRTLGFEAFDPEAGPREVETLDFESFAGRPAGEQAEQRVMDFEDFGSGGSGREYRIAEFDEAGAPREAVPIMQIGDPGTGELGPPAPPGRVASLDGLRARVSRAERSGPRGGPLKPDRRGARRSGSGVARGRSLFGDPDTDPGPGADRDGGVGQAPDADAIGQEPGARPRRGRAGDAGPRPDRGTRRPRGPRSDGSAAEGPEDDSLADVTGDDGRAEARRTGRTSGRGRAGTVAPEADPEAAAKEICLNLLEYRARTRQELAQALRKKDIPDAVSNRVLERFDEVGLIDDEAFAGQWVRSRHRQQGLGRRALAVELQRKGVAKEVAEEALAEVDTESEELRARQLVDKRLRSMTIASPDDRAKAGRRLIGMLARKGYQPGVVYGVVREALAAHGAEDDELGPADLD
jgi:regulatory protein